MQISVSPQGPPSPDVPQGLGSMSEILTLAVSTNANTTHLCPGSTEVLSTVLAATIATCYLFL